MVLRHVSVMALGSLAPTSEENVTNYSGCYTRALSWLLQNVREDVDSNLRNWSLANTRTLNRDSCKGLLGLDGVKT